MNFNILRLIRFEYLNWLHNSIMRTKEIRQEKAKWIKINDYEYTFFICVITKFE